MKMKQPPNMLGKSYKTPEVKKKSPRHRFAQVSAIVKKLGSKYAV